MPDELESIRQLAEHIGRGRSTVGAWVLRDDWPFERSPPWTTDTAAAIGAWSETLRGGGQRAERDRADDGFWADRDARPPLAVRSAEGRPLPADHLPHELVSEWERACIAAGVADLSPARLAELVADAVACRAYLADVPRWVAAWLVGHDADEIARRLRTVILDRITLTTAMAQWIGTNRQPGGPATGDGRDGQTTKPNRRRGRQESGS